MAAMFIVSTAACVLMLASDTPRYHFGGLLGLVMFGGVGGAWFIGEFLTRPAPPPHTGLVTFADGTSARGMIFAGRPGKARVSVVAQLSLLFSALLFALPSLALGGLALI